MRSPPRVASKAAKHALDGTRECARHGIEIARLESLCIGLGEVLGQQALALLVPHPDPPHVLALPPHSRQNGNRTGLLPGKAGGTYG